MYELSRDQRIEQTRQKRRDAFIEQISGALSRAKLRAERGPQQQLDLLDKRLGIGRGAIRERARLAKQIQDRQEALAALKAEKEKKEKERREKEAKQDQKKKKFKKRGKHAVN